MRTSTRASVGVVTELMDVHASFGVGVIASDIVGDGGGTVFGGLFKGDGAFDVGVSSEDGDCEERKGVC